MLELPRTEQELTQWALEYSGLEHSFFVFTSMQVRARLNEIPGLTFLERHSRMTQHTREFQSWVMFVFESFPQCIRVNINFWGYYQVYLAGVPIISGVREEDALYTTIHEWVKKYHATT